MEKAREFQKKIYFCFLDYAKAFDCVDHNKLWKILKEMGIQTTWPAFCKTYMQARKQQLELDMEQCRGLAPVDPGNTNVGTALASLEITYLITDREGLED